jgi:multidrug efflux pump subunit AcrB
VQSAFAPLFPGVSLLTLPPADERDVVLRYALGSPRLSAIDLRALHDSRVARSLLTIPGVAEIHACGGRGKRIEVEVDLARAAAFGLGIPEIGRAIRSSGGPGGRGDAGRHRGPEVIAEIVVPGPKPVQLRDLARVSVDGAPPECDALGARGEPVVLAEVRAPPDAGAGAGEVARVVAARLREIAATLPPDAVLEVVPDASDAFVVSARPPAGVAAPRARALADALRAAGAAAPGVGHVLAFGRFDEEVRLLVVPAPGGVPPQEVLGRIAALPDARSARVSPATRAARGALARWQPVGLRVAGADLAALREVTARVQRALAGEPAVALVNVAGAAEQQRSIIVSDRAALARLGVAERDVIDSFASATRGTTVASFADDDRLLDVVLLARGDLPVDRLLDRMWVADARGGRILLALVARVEQRLEPREVRREAGQRCIRIDVTAPTLAPRALAERLRALIAPVELPPGVTVAVAVEP